MSARSSFPARRMRHLAGQALLLAGLTLSLAPVRPAAAQPPAGGAVPRVVRFDGVTTAPAGGVATPATVTLSLYDAPTGGTLRWEETQAVTVDAQGRYVVHLGAASPEGLPADALAGDGPPWLQVQFAGAAPLARTPLTSVPFALRASDAETLGGLPVSAFLRAPDPASGGGTAADGTAADAGRGTPPLVNTGTPGFIGKFVDNIDLTSSVMFEANGRIGVGTGASTPLDFIHSRFTDNFGGVTGLAVQNMGSSTSSYSGMLFYDHTGSLRQFQGYNNSTGEYRINNISPTGSINFMLSSTSRFRVRPDGDVEIPGNLYKGQFIFLRAAGSGSTHSIGLGEQALNNSVGTANVAIGSQAIGGPGSGGTFNIGIGNSSLSSNAGVGNVAIGDSALGSSTGNYTTAIGYNAGTAKFGANNYNIYVGAAVGSGGSTESNTIRIGDTANYQRFFAGGIRGVTTGTANAVNVVIDSTGQLGTISSSRRFKTDIQDMGEASSGLMRLRPVTYRYTQPYADGSMPIDYGLIAEEVAEVYPDIVTHSSDGQVETVQYQKVNAMLLNEVQKQHREIEAQRREIADLTARLAALERALTAEKR